MQIERTKTDVYWVHCQVCGTDGPRTEDLAEAERRRVEHRRKHQGGEVPSAAQAESDASALQRVADAAVEWAALAEAAAPMSYVMDARELQRLEREADETLRDAVADYLASEPGEGICRR